MHGAELAGGYAVFKAEGPVKGGIVAEADSAGDFVQTYAPYNIALGGH